MNLQLQVITEETLKIMSLNPEPYPLRPTRDSAVIRLCHAAGIIDDHLGGCFSISVLAHAASHFPTELDESVERIRAVLQSQFESRKEVQ